MNYKIMYATDEFPTAITAYDKGYLFTSADTPVIISSANGKKLPISGIIAVDMAILEDFGEVLSVTTKTHHYIIACVLIYFKTAGFAVGNHWQTRNLKEDLMKFIDLKPLSSLNAGYYKIKNTRNS